MTTTRKTATAKTARKLGKLKLTAKGRPTRAEMKEFNERVGISASRARAARTARLKAKTATTMEMAARRMARTRTMGDVDAIAFNLCNFAKANGLGGDTVRAFIPHIKMSQVAPSLQDYLVQLNNPYRDLEEVLIGAFRKYAASSEGPALVAAVTEDDPGLRVYKATAWFHAFLDFARWDRTAVPTAQSKKPVKKAKVAA
jgi:hypothetical protein